MNIIPNATIKFNEYSELLEVELIEVPPHDRTLRVYGGHAYCHIPYTQFYFTNFKSLYLSRLTPLTLITSTAKSIREETPKLSVFSNTRQRICWGFSYNVQKNPLELISTFWLSSFYYKPVQLLTEQHAILIDKFYN